MRQQRGTPPRRRRLHDDDHDDDANDYDDDDERRPPTQSHFIFCVEGLKSQPVFHALCVQAWEELIMAGKTLVLFEIVHDAQRAIEEHHLHTTLLLATPLPSCMNALCVQDMVRVSYQSVLELAKVYCGFHEEGAGDLVCELVDFHANHDEGGKTAGKEGLRLRRTWVSRSMAGPQPGPS